MDEVDKAEELTRSRVDRVIAGIRRSLAPRLINGARFCRDCSDAIPAERVAAIPSADRCAPCQTIRERGIA